MVLLIGVGHSHVSSASVNINSIDEHPLRGGGPLPPPRPQAWFQHNALWASDQIKPSPAQRTVSGGVTVLLLCNGRWRTVCP